MTKVSLVPELAKRQLPAPTGQQPNKRPPYPITDLESTVREIRAPSTCTLITWCQRDVNVILIGDVTGSCDGQIFRTVPSSSVSRFLHHFGRDIKCSKFRQVMQGPVLYFLDIRGLSFVWMWAGVNACPNYEMVPKMYYIWNLAEIKLTLCELILGSLCDICHSRCVAMTILGS